jgi:hypothetical protein
MRLCDFPGYVKLVDLASTSGDEKHVLSDFPPNSDT